MNSINLKRIIMLWIFVLLLMMGCSQGPRFYEQIGPAGNTYIDSKEPAEDDSDQIITVYCNFPDIVKQKIEQLLPGGKVDQIMHWGPFRYVVYKSYSDGHSNKIYIYLSGRTQQIYYMEGQTMEKPGVFFETGTEKIVGLSDIPEVVLVNAKKHSGSDKIIKTWIAESDIGSTYVVEVVGFQENDTTAFAYRQDGTLKTMSIAKRMQEGVARKWSTSEIEDLLGKYRKKYSVERVLKRIQSTEYDPTEGFRFVVFGDNRINQSVWEAICKSVSQKHPLFAIATGDLVNEGETEQFNDYLFGVLEKYGRFNFVPVIGNHDIYYDGLAVSYLTAFGPNSLNYTFDYGNARFVILDNCSRRTQFIEHLNIAEQWLAETPSGFYKFVFLHTPPGDIKKWSYHAMNGEKSQRFTELMTKYQVDHVFAGHIHAYSTASYQGVDYTVTGGAGAKLHMQYGPKGSVHHYVIVDVKPDSIQQQLVRIYNKD